MNNEVKDLKQDGNGDDANVVRNVIPALVLIVIGGGLLASNFLGISFENWWALFLLIPVIGLFYQVGRDQKSNGRLTRRSIAPLSGVLVLMLVIATFLFDVDWDQIWPAFFFIGAIAVLLGNRS